MSTYLYSTAAPEGRVFHSDAEVAQAVKDGWVDAPNKIDESKESWKGEKQAADQLEKERNAAKGRKGEDESPDDSDPDKTRAKGGKHR